MGYTTSFSGTFELDKPLTVEHKDILDDLNENRQSGVPSYWCQWVPNESGTGIEWDGGEKFYDYVEWIQIIIDNYLKPWGYKLNGRVTWAGEDDDDLGSIRVTDNEVVAKPATIIY